MTNNHVNVGFRQELLETANRRRCAGMNSFHSLYNSSWLGDLKNSQKIYSHWHKPTTTQIFWSNKLISQQWYHPSQFLCSQSWLHLWHDFLWSNQLYIQILSFSYPRHPSNSSLTWLDYCNSLYSGISQTNLNKLQRIQNSLACVITNTSKYQHITPLKKLHWLPIKQRIDYKICLLTYKTLTNQQPTYLYNSLSFPLHSVSKRSSDSLVLSICPIITWQKGFLCHRSTTLEFTPSQYLKLVFSTNIPFQAQNTVFQNCIPSLGSFPSPLTVYPDTLSNDT